MKLGETMRLKGKKEFTVDDLINLLHKFDKNNVIRFGVIIDSINHCYSQDENFIFRLSKDAIDSENKILNILTEHKI